MSLWMCIECGAQAIAHDLGFCPQCFKPREAEVARVTRGGFTNADDPATVPDEAQEAPSTAQGATQEPEVPQEVQKVQEDAKDVLSELEAAAASLQRPAKKQDG